MPGFRRLRNRAAEARSSDSVVRTSGGVPEVDVAWLRANRDRVRLVDVREPDEWSGALEIIDGAERVPLAGLAAASSAWSPDEPIALICRSGGRSGVGALQLERRGFTRVVSVAGGMLAWRR